MREIKGVEGGKLILKDGKVALIYEKTVTPYGNGAKVDAPKKHIGKRAYVVIMKG
jgi:putative transposon-encoded protein